MKKLLVVVAIIICFTLPNKAQHFIGLHKEDVKQLMKETNKSFHLDNTSVNKSFNYLKYIDNLGEQTILFFLDDNDNCTTVRHMCDYSGYDHLMNEVKSKYTQLADGYFIYQHSAQLYEVKLEEGEWFFTLTTRLKQNK